MCVRMKEERGDGGRWKYCTYSDTKSYLSRLCDMRILVICK